MPLSASSFEYLNPDRDIGPDATRQGQSPFPKPAQVSSMATIGPQIESEIPFLQRLVHRWYRKAADADADTRRVLKSGGKVIANEPYTHSLLQRVRESHLVLLRHNDG